ncbi:MAG: DUF4190 domain-containing protein [Sandaracinaceae bacterium]
MNNPPHGPPGNQSHPAAFAPTQAMQATPPQSGSSQVTPVHGGFGQPAGFGGQPGYGGPQPAFGQPPSAAATAVPTSRPTNQMAIVSVIAGAVGWVGVPLVASIVAIITGHMARQQIRQSGEEGDTLAIAGLVLGYAHIAMLCLVGAALVVFYGGLAAFIVASQPH